MFETQIYFLKIVPCPKTVLDCVAGEIVSVREVLAAET